MASQNIPDPSNGRGEMGPPNISSNLGQNGLEQHFHEKTLCFVNVFNEPGTYDIRVRFPPLSDQQKRNLPPIPPPDYSIATTSKHPSSPNAPEQ